MIVVDFGCGIGTSVDMFGLGFGLLFIVAIVDSVDF